MLTIDVDPQVSVLAPRPAPDEVLIFTCDAAGAECWLKMSKKLFDEITGGDGAWLRILEEGTARLYEQEGKAPSPDWTLLGVRAGRTESQ